MFGCFISIIHDKVQWTFKWGKTHSSTSNSARVFKYNPELLSVTLIFNYVVFPAVAISISIKCVLFCFAHFIKSKFRAQLTFHLFNKWRNIYPDSHFIVELQLLNKICSLWIKKKKDGIYFSYTKTVLLFLHIKDKNLYT